MSDNNTTTGTTIISGLVNILSAFWQVIKAWITSNFIEETDKGVSIATLAEDGKVPMEQLNCYDTTTIDTKLAELKSEVNSILANKIGAVYDADTKTIELMESAFSYNADSGYIEAATTI